MPEFESQPISPVSGPAAYPAGYGTVPPRADAYDGLPPLSQGQRVADTFFTPSRTFADIRRDRSWWLPYVLVVLFSLLFGAVVHQRVPADTLAENTMRSNPAQREKLQNASPEQRATTLRYAGTMMQVSLFSGPVSFLIVPAVMALLIWVGFNFILGGSSTYPGMFAVAMYAALPALVFDLLVIATVFAGNAENFNLSNMAGTNIGYYLSPDTSPGLKSLLASIDIFSIWQMFLLGLGGAILARVKVRNGLMLVFGVWLLFILVRAGIAAV